MKLHHKIIQWIKKMFDTQTTDKIFESTNILKRKIIYKGILPIIYPTMSVTPPYGSDSNWTAYLQEDLASRYMVGSQSVTIPEINYAGNFSIDAVISYINETINYQSYKLPVHNSFSGPVSTEYTQDYWGITLSNDGGKLKVTFYGKSSTGIPGPLNPDNSTYIWYVIYSTNITEEAVL
jgi:hypothetical protein